MNENHSIATTWHKRSTFKQKNRTNYLFFCFLPTINVKINDKFTLRNLNASLFLRMLYTLVLVRVHFEWSFFPYSLLFQIEYFLILITAVCFGCVHYRYILICGASWLSVTILLNIYIFSNSVIICMQYASNNANVMDELNCHFYQKYTSICRSWQHYCTMRNGSNLEWDGMM